MWLCRTLVMEVHGVMLDPRGETFSCWEPMLLIPFYRLVGKGEDGPCVPKLQEEASDCIVLYMLWVCHTPDGRC